MNKVGIRIPERCSFRIATLLAAASLALLTTPSFSQDKDPANMPKSAISIADHRQLLCMPELIDRLSGDARFQLHHPQRREIVLTTDAPWEGNMSGVYATVFRDGDICRLYYKTAHLDVAKRAGGGQAAADAITFRVCYAESEDGLTWRKPELGLYEFEGSKANNIVWTGSGEKQCGVHGFAPFRDDNPDCAPEARYKAVGGVRHSTRGDLYAMRSPDGIHWSLMGDEPIMRQGGFTRFDSQNVAFWDAERGEYRIYFREYIGGRPGRGGVRGIKTATSDDFVNWSEPEWLAYPGSPEAQLYTNVVQPYFRAPNLLIGFPLRYTHREWSPAIEALPELEHRRQRAAINPRFGTSLTDSLFMASRDRRTFHRWDEAFLRPGPQQQGSWTYGDTSIAHGMLVTPSALEGAPDELSLFAAEGYWRGNSARLRRLTLRQDGFVSVTAPLRGGEVLTKPLRFEGDHLTLNVATSAAGSVCVEIQHPDGSAIDGFALEDCDEVIGDELDRTVSWRGNPDVSALAGKPVRLRFELNDSNIYAFAFR